LPILPLARENGELDDDLLSQRWERRGRLDGDVVKDDDGARAAVMLSRNVVAGAAASDSVNVRTEGVGSMLGSKRNN
jgi:hypothetical protein